MTTFTGSAAVRRKIVILGGGIGALTSAFELTGQPGWEGRYDITIHQLGWRLGGKCASSRGLNGRIQEHGIHGFLGSYYNTMPMMAACYAELGRAAGEPLATFEEAFLPESFILMWEWRDRALRRWPLTFPTNAYSPADGTRFVTTQQKLVAALEVVSAIFERHTVNGLAERQLAARTHDLVRRLALAIEDAAATIVILIDETWRALTGPLLELVDGNDTLRRLFTVADYIFTIIRGAIVDDLGGKGYDSIDDQNWSDWLLAHGANPKTVSSPLALNTINLSYQYPTGDTSVPPRWLPALMFNGPSGPMLTTGRRRTCLPPAAGRP